jgi:signal transduction histidine kinase
MPAEAPHRPARSLRSQLLLGLLGYVVLLSVAVAVHGAYINELAERMVWRSVLDAELDHFLARRNAEPTQPWIDTPTMSVLEGGSRALPAGLRELPPGLHDDIAIGGVERVVLVRDVDGRRIYLMQDIAELERAELDIGLRVAGAAVLLILVLGLAIAWRVNRLVRPLASLAGRIAALHPDRPGQQLDVRDDASSELAVIADALNDYLARNERFVERERAFIDSVSHELRTPVAVIAGAAEIALERPGLPDPTRQQLGRIHRTALDVEELVGMLLVLARDPARLATAGEPVALDALLPELVESHRHLTRGRDLELVLEPLPPCTVVAPLPVLQVAIGNLLRNAIEHSDRGRISVRLDAPATLVIDDPGHGMGPEEISALYGRVAREGRGAGAGIGLALIARLCEHLGWRLAFSARAGQGTTTTLDLSPQGTA